MVETLHSYALVCLTSPNGAELLFDGAGRARARRAGRWRTRRSRRSAREPRAALRERGLIADIVPPRSIAESLVESLREVEVADRPVLIARAAEARDVLPEALAERGAAGRRRAAVRDRPRARRRRAGRGDRRRRLRHLHLLVDRAASSSRPSATAFPAGARVVSIGPVTSETARELGLEVAVEAERHDPDGPRRGAARRRHLTWVSSAQHDVGRMTQVGVGPGESTIYSGPGWACRSRFSPTTGSPTTSPGSAAR